MPPESFFPSTIWGEIRPGPSGGGEANAAALRVLAERYGRGIVAYFRALEISQAGNPAAQPAECPSGHARGRAGPFL